MIDNSINLKARKIFSDEFVKNYEFYLLFDIGQLSIDLINQSLVVLVQVLLADVILRLNLHTNSSNVPFDLLHGLGDLPRILGEMLSS